MYTSINNGAGNLVFIYFFFSGTLSEHRKLTKVKKSVKTFTMRTTLHSLRIQLFGNRQQYARPFTTKEKKNQVLRWGDKTNE